jgi:4-diphosphocytidyl-2-C-methyl-D-erythritol kinase
VTLLRAHAKLNLFLTVLGRRPDGFHDLSSVFHAIDIADDVELGPGAAVDMAMEVPGSVDDEDNLVTRALTSLGVAGAVGVRVTKRIPVAAGLGGGSSDAAATLLGARDHLGLGLVDAELLRLGEGLGSDVPFFLQGSGTALVEGRGERVTGLDVAPVLWFVVGVTFRALSTAAVYARWDELDTLPGPRTSGEMIEALGVGDLTAIAGLLHNDLEAAATTMVPELAAKKEALVEAGALGALVAGSGPTVFGLAGGPDHAQAIADNVPGVFDRVHVATSSARSIERVR